MWGPNWQGQARNTGGRTVQAEQYRQNRTGKKGVGFEGGRQFCFSFIASFFFGGGVFQLNCSLLRAQRCRQRGWPPMAMSAAWAVRLSQHG